MSNFRAYLTAFLLPIVTTLTAIAPVNAQELLPPPPAGPNPVPDPAQFQFTPNASSYRVLALVNSSVQEKQVKVSYPGAFYTNYNGRRMLQIGSFSDPLNAQQAALTLQNLGLETAIDP
jgi:hypothetical protein